MKGQDKILAGILIVFTLVMVGVILKTATERELSSQEAIFMQALSFLGALGSSYLFSRQGAEKLAREMFAPHARSAFRRIVALYRGVSHMVQIVDSEDDNRVKDDNSRLLAIRTIALEQIQTANDALEDWREIVPEAVEELEKDIPKDGG